MRVPESGQSSPPPTPALPPIQADFRDGDAYEALSSALTSRMDSELRPIDVCNATLPDRTHVDTM